MMGTIYQVLIKQQNNYIYKTILIIQKTTNLRFVYYGFYEFCFHQNNYKDKSKYFKGSKFLNIVTFQINLNNFS